MKISSPILIAIALSFGAAAAPRAQQSGHALFEQALARERVDGNLRDAIAVYERVVAEFGSDRPLAARALVQIGLCYEKLGRDEARKAYERLVRDFADQKDAVAQARVRLAALEKAGPVLATGGTQPGRRLIFELRLPADSLWMDLPHLAADGRHQLAYDSTVRAFKLIDIDTKQVRQLTADGTGPVDARPIEYVLSKDGRRIAMTAGAVPKSAAGPLKLYVLDVGTHAPARLVYSWPDGVPVRPFAWSAGNDRVGVMVMHPSAMSIDMTWVALDGKLTTLKTLTWRNDTQQPSLSPDGRFIACHAATDRTAKPDVYIVAADGSRETRIESPASDSKPVFTPDGTGIVFESDRRGVRDLWFQPLNGGQPSGEARLVWRDLGAYGMSLGFKENGSLFYYVGMDRWEVYTTSLDGSENGNGAGSVGAPQLLAPRHLEQNEAPAFSADGRFLVHMREGRRMVIRDLADGGEREIPFERRLIGTMLDWCPRAEQVIATAYDNGIVAYRVDVRTGTIRKLALQEPQHTVCLGDGSELVYIRALKPRDPGPIVQQVVRYSETSREEQVLYSTTGDIHSDTLSRSPDGQQISFVTDDESQAQLIVMSSAGGQTRELMTSGYAGKSPWRYPLLRAAVWSPDGASLLVLRRNDDSKNPVTSKRPLVGKLALLRVPVDGSAAHPVGTLAPPEFEESRFGARKFSLSTDGHVLAFENHRGFVGQIWAIDNLLKIIHTP